VDNEVHRFDVDCPRATTRSHPKLGLPCGRFQDDGGFGIAGVYRQAIRARDDPQLGMLVRYGNIEMQERNYLDSNPQGSNSAVCDVQN